MENKNLIKIFIVALICSVLFLGASLTGMIVYKVEYNNLCRDDSNCLDGQCCLVYQDKDLGICMENCQSFEFLCKKDSECEKETVCCKSEGMEYGICNYQEKCLSVDIFADYVGKVSFLEPEQIPSKQNPAKIDPDKMIAIEALVIIGLIGFIIWILFKDKKKK